MRPLRATLASLLPLCLGENITARDGITAGFHGIYTCSGDHWQGTCVWHEIQYADIESKNCIHLHSDQGFGSIGPDKRLGLSIHGRKVCLVDPWAGFGPLTCPGNDVLSTNKQFQGTTDLYVRVKMLERADMPQTLPEISNGLSPGFRGLYISPEAYWAADCFWKESQPEERDGNKGINLHFEHGFGSLGPNKGLRVTVYKTNDCSGEPWDTLDKLDCSGEEILATRHVAEGWEDSWVTVRKLDRKEFKKNLPEECEF